MASICFFAVKLISCLLKSNKMSGAASGAEADCVTGGDFATGVAVVATGGAVATGGSVVAGGVVAGGAVRTGSVDVGFCGGFGSTWATVAGVAGGEGTPRPDALA